MPAHTQTLILAISGGGAALLSFVLAAPDHSRAGRGVFDYVLSP